MIVCVKHVIVMSIERDSRDRRMKPAMNEQQIRKIERPHPNLMKLYLIRCLLTGPGLIIALPLYYFRYHTLRYSFDEEGIHMRWGILFRRQINLTYTRIQDIHLISGFIQRWLKLADIHIQTASGSSSAEMKIEGLLEYEEVRSFLYSKMRGAHDRSSAPMKAGAAPARATLAASGEELELLRDIQNELRLGRVAMERLAERSEREAGKEGDTNV
jgi:membrane protein YdbS with pleckstrin-like domain